MLHILVEMYRNPPFSPSWSVFLLLVLLRVFNVQAWIVGNIASFNRYLLSLCVL